LDITWCCHPFTWDGFNGVDIASKKHGNRSGYCCVQVTSAAVSKTIVSGILIDNNNDRYQWRKPFITSEAAGYFLDWGASA